MSKGLIGAGGCASQVIHSLDCQAGIGFYSGGGGTLISSADRLLPRLHQSLHDVVADFHWSE